MNFGDQILYYVVDMGIVFLLGIVIGIVIRRAFMYLIALMILPLAYFGFYMLMSSGMGEAV